MVTCPLCIAMIIQLTSFEAEHNETRKVLSTHAMVKAALTGNVPPALYASFQDGNTDYLRDDQSREARAYYNFWKEHREYNEAEYKRRKLP